MNTINFLISSKTHHHKLFDFMGNKWKQTSDYSEEKRKQKSFPLLFYVIKWQKIANH